MSSGGYDDNGDWHWNDGDSTNPAAELRAAAKAMREAAQQATQGPWRRAADAGELGKGYAPNFIAFWDGEYLAGVADTGHGDGTECAARDARYIASMHPLVGAALADWLDAAAQAWDEHMEWDEALAVARAYLNTEAAWVEFTERKRREARRA